MCKEEEGRENSRLVSSDLSHRDGLACSGLLEKLTSATAKLRLVEQVKWCPYYRKTCISINYFKKSYWSIIYVIIFYLYELNIANLRFSSSLGDMLSKDPASHGNDGRSRSIKKEWKYFTKSSNTTSSYREGLWFHTVNPAMILWNIRVNSEQGEVSYFCFVLDQSHREQSDTAGCFGHYGCHTVGVL